MEKEKLLEDMSGNIMKINNIHKKLANYIHRNKKSQKFLQKVEANTGLYSGIFAFIVGATLKPTTIFFVTKDKEDGKYAIARSISTALADVALAVAIFVPLKRGLDKSAKRLYNSVGTAYYQNPDACSRFKSISNRIFKIMFTPFFAMAKFSLIAPIVKKINGMKNEDNR